MCVQANSGFADFERALRASDEALVQFYTGCVPIHMKKVQTVNDIMRAIQVKHNKRLLQRQLKFVTGCTWEEVGQRVDAYTARDDVVEVVDLGQIGPTGNQHVFVPLCLEDNGFSILNQFGNQKQPHHQCDSVDLAAIVRPIQPARAASHVQAHEPSVPQTVPTARGRKKAQPKKAAAPARAAANDATEPSGRAEITAAAKDAAPKQRKRKAVPTGQTEGATTEPIDTATKEKKKRKAVPTGQTEGATTEPIETAAKEKKKRGRPKKKVLEATAASAEAAAGGNDGAANGAGDEVVAADVEPTKKSAGGRKKKGEPKDAAAHSESVQTETEVVMVPGKDGPWNTDNDLEAKRSRKKWTFTEYDLKVFAEIRERERSGRDAEADEGNQDAIVDAVADGGNVSNAPTPIVGESSLEPVGGTGGAAREFAVDNAVDIPSEQVACVLPHVQDAAGEEVDEMIQPSTEKTKKKKKEKSSKKKKSSSKKKLSENNNEAREPGSPLSEELV